MKRLMNRSLLAVFLTCMSQTQACIIFSNHKWCEKKAPTASPTMYVCPQDWYCDSITLRGSNDYSVATNGVSPIVRIPEIPIPDIPLVDLWSFNAADFGSPCSSPNNKRSFYTSVESLLYTLTVTMYYPVTNPVMFYGFTELAIESVCGPLGNVCVPPKPVMQFSMEVCSLSGGRTVNDNAVQADKSGGKFEIDFPGVPFPELTGVDIFTGAVMVRGEDIQTFSVSFPLGMPITLLAMGWN